MELGKIYLQLPLINENTISRSVACSCSSCHFDVLKKYAKEALIIILTKLSATIIFRIILFTKKKDEQLVPIGCMC